MERGLVPPVDSAVYKEACEIHSNIVVVVDSCGWAVDEASPGGTIPWCHWGGVGPGALIDKVPPHFEGAEGSPETHYVLVDIPEMANMSGSLSHVCITFDWDCDERAWSETESNLSLTRICL